MRNYISRVVPGQAATIATLTMLMAGCSSDPPDGGDGTKPINQGSQDPTPSGTDDPDDGSGNGDDSPTPGNPDDGEGEDPGASVTGTCGAGEVLEVTQSVIAADETWGCTLTPYTVTSSLSVVDSATLTLKPGVTVAFDRGTSLIIGDGIGGHLVAEGTAQMPIRFTSLQSTPAPGDWQAVVIQSEGADATFEHVVLEYGGTYCTSSISPGEGMLQILGAVAAVTNTRFMNSSGYGIVLRNGGRATEFHDNDFTGNPAAPIYAEPEVLDTLKRPNTFDDGDRVMVPAGWVTLDTTWDSLGAPYEIQGDIAIGGKRQPLLTIEPGATLLFHAEASLVVGNGKQGSLLADGSEATITFSAAKSPASAGDWRAVVFDSVTDSSRSLIKASSFQYCGATGAPSSKPVHACIGVIDSSPTIQNTSFSHSSSNGIQLIGSAAPVLSGNTFTDIAGEDVAGP